MKKKIGGIKKVISAAMAGVFAITMMSGCGNVRSNSGTGNGTASATSAASATQSEPFDEESSKTKKKTAEIESIINDKFYFNEDSSKRDESYYDGIMAGLDDPYSVYYTPEEYAKLEEDDGGQYVGIGATVAKNPDTGEIYVVKPLRGSPAEEAGLKKNDVFVQVDGTNITTNMELEDVVKMIRGSKGSTAHLKMYREGDSDYRTFDIKRRKVENVTVDYEMLDGNIGYITVEEFIDNTAKQFEEAVDTLEKKGAKSIIVDVRNNPGGLLTAVLEMADYIIKDDAKAKGAASAGLLLETKDKTGKVIESYSCKDGHSVNLPMVVLANENSASASEIFTGCMKDYGIATIIGTTTFGKGIVQQVIPLDDGSAIKITIAKYFTPAGKDIHKKGIDPDIKVELDDSIKNETSIPHSKDNQLQRAVKELGGAALASDTDAD